MGLCPLWFGRLAVGVNSNLPAESISACPGMEDRSGPGNNKSIYERNTGENETGSSPPRFSADTLSPSVMSEPSYMADVAQGQDRSCYGYSFLLFLTWSPARILMAEFRGDQHLAQGYRCTKRILPTTSKDCLRVKTWLRLRLGLGV